MLRAVYSERQLDEVLVDFWMNHFNVYANKGPEKFLVGAYERDVIRPHAWGRFEDLLLATAKSPAMLFYLDNWLSADPEAATAPGMTGGAAQARAQRELRPRDHGAAHPRRGRRLHAEGRHRGRPRASPAGRSRGLRDGEPRFAFNARVHDRGDKIGPRPAHQGRRAGRGRAGASTCWPPIRRPRASSPTSWRAGSWPTSRRRRWSIAPRRRSAAPTATSARW